MIDNPVIKAMLERRSIRKFTDEPVDREAILTILEAGRWAPNGQNKQACRVLPVLAGDPRRELLAGLTKYTHFLNQAQALLCVFLDKSRCYDEIKDRQSAGAFIQNMLLAAHSMGLGALWVGEIINRKEQVTKALNMDPEAYEMQAVVLIGHPDQKGSSTRLPLEDYLLESL